LVSGKETSIRYRDTRPSLLSGLALSLAAILFCFWMGEIAIRIFHPSASLWHYPNFITVATKPNPDHALLMRYDGVLGYEPRPNAAGMAADQPVSFSADGLRNQNLDAPPAMGPVILAVGDSITEGWGVKDNETWPAHLERDTGRRVLNGGVRSYGLDQIILRAERLAPRFKPRTIVLGFIEDDIARTTFAARLSVPKPYFVPVGEGVELRNVPVPQKPYSSSFDIVRRILGYSYLLDFTMRRLGAYDLWYGDTLDIGVDADLISCRLMERFAALVKNQGAKGLVVAFPEYPSWTDPPLEASQRRRVTAVLACASRAGLPTLDTHDGFVAAGANRNPDAYYTRWHFNDRGNALAAKLIAAALEAAER
jgi:lysophospholipase L1-like esterase